MTSPLRDEDFAAFSARRQRTVLMVSSALILVLNPIFEVLMRFMPGSPAGYVALRLIPMLTAALALLVHARQRGLELSCWSTIGVACAQIICSTAMIIQSGSALSVVAASLTPIYAIQMAYNRFQDLVVTLVVSALCYALHFLIAIDSPREHDFFGLTMILSAFLITGLLGAVRIRDLEQTRRSEHALARQSLALEQTEASARLAAEAADQANRAKSAFLATMSHELRTPLNAVIGYAELLIEVSEEDGFEKITPDLERIVSSATHLLDLLSQILDLSKVEAGRMERVIATLELKPFVLELEEIGRTLARAHQNTLELRLGSLPEVIQTDAVKLRQIALNLLSNASKFTEQGRITLAIDGEQPDRLTLKVSDTGIGMSERQIDRLFRPFAQVHDRLERERYGGTGLGLMLCKRLTELLGGTIQVQSEPDRGTTFTITIPTGTQPPTPDAGAPLPRLTLS